MIGTGVEGASEVTRMHRQTASEEDGEIGEMSARPAVAAGERPPLLGGGALVEARLAIELPAARSAATEPELATIDHLRRALASMRAASHRGELAGPYVDFHLGVARATRNPVLEACFSVLLRRIAASIEADPPTSQRVRGWLDQHDVLVRRIAARDPRGATVAMAMHLDPQEHYRRLVRDLG